MDSRISSYFASLTSKHITTKRSHHEPYSNNTSIQYHNLALIQTLLLPSFTYHVIFFFTTEVYYIRSQGFKTFALLTPSNPIVVVVVVECMFYIICSMTSYCITHSYNNNQLSFVSITFKQCGNVSWSARKEKHI